MSDSFRAVRIDIDGSAEVLERDLNNGTTLDLLQKGVGGYVDVVSLDRQMDMWLNDNGLNEGLPVNLVATYMARKMLNYPAGPYVGPVVLTGGADDEGETLSLTVDQVKLILDALS